MVASPCCHLAREKVCAAAPPDYGAASFLRAVRSFHTPDKKNLSVWCSACSIKTLQLRFQCTTMCCGLINKRTLSLEYTSPATVSAWRQNSAGAVNVLERLAATEPEFFFYFPQDQNWAEDKVSICVTSSGRYKHKRDGALCICLTRNVSKSLYKVRGIYFHVFHVFMVG